MKIIGSLCLLMLHGYLYSCDICGGASSASSVGIMPDQQYHLIGSKWLYRAYQSEHQDVFTQQKTYSKEYFNTWEMNGRWQVHPKIQLYTIIPLVYNLQNKDAHWLSKVGVGDVSVMGQYLWLNAKDSLRDRRFFFSTGLAIKLPTGYHAKDNHITSNLNPGTGAFDFTPNLNFSYQRKKHGVNLELSYAARLKNPQGYQFGNALNANASYLLALENWKGNKWLFQIGINVKNFEHDRIFGAININSLNHGYQFNGLVGVNYFGQKWNVFLHYLPPIYQQIGKGSIHQSGTYQFGINYLIKKT